MPVGTGARSAGPDAVVEPDRCALRACVVRHLDLIERIVKYRAGPKVLRVTTVEDLVQDVVVEALGQEHNFEYQGEACFVGWISKIARRVVSARARTAAHSLPVVSIEVNASTASDAGGQRMLGTAPSAFEVAVEHDRCSELIGALGRLPEKDRAVIALIKLEEHPIQECTAAWGCSANAIRLRLGRAMSRLAGNQDLCSASSR